MPVSDISHNIIKEQYPHIHWSIDHCSDSELIKLNSTGAENISFKIFSWSKLVLNLHEP